MRSLQLDMGVDAVRPFAPDVWQRRTPRAAGRRRPGERRLVDFSRVMTARMSSIRTLEIWRIRAKLIGIPVPVRNAAHACAPRGRRMDRAAVGYSQSTSEWVIHPWTTTSVWTIPEVLIRRDVVGRLRQRVSGIIESKCPPGGHRGKAKRCGSDYAWERT